jgi:glycosyltransferase involved in cell wall biosynthesis
LSGLVFVLALSDVAMNSDRKGEKVLLRALKELEEEGIDCRAIIIGDGPKRKEFEDFASQLGIKWRVHFTGLLGSPAEVRHFLEESDMFVFPTLAEGLPRGILEAMALGMVVVSSPVGGIPEIINREYLVDPEDSHGYAETIKKLVSDRQIMNKVSEQNYKKSLEFKNDLLQKKRDAFYTKLAELAQ